MKIETITKVRIENEEDKKILGQYIDFFNMLLMGSPTPVLKLVKSNDTDTVIIELIIFSSNFAINIFDNELNDFIHYMTNDIENLVTKLAEFKELYPDVDVDSLIKIAKQVMKHE